MTKTRRLLAVAGSVIGLAVLAVLGFAGFMAARMGPRNAWGLLRYDTRHEGGLKVGDRAPDVELVGLDGAPGVHLAARLGGRPVVLTFGSFT